MICDEFIGYCNEDKDTALEIEDHFMCAGFSTWCYHTDGIPGQRWMEQVDGAIDRFNVALIIVSPTSIDSREVDSEEIRAYNRSKPFVPVMLGMTHIEFQKKKERWDMIYKDHASITVPYEVVPSMFPRLAVGVKTLILNEATKTGESVPQRYPVDEVFSALRNLSGVH